MTDTESTADTEIATDETDNLIASNKVEGTAVYDEDGDKLGSIYNFMPSTPGARPTPEPASSALPVEGRS